MAESIQRGTPEQFEILTASVQDHQIAKFLTNKLMPLMPYSLPIYRRCQFHLKEVSIEQHNTNNNGSLKSRGAEVWIGLAILKSKSRQLTHNDWLEEWLQNASSPVGKNNHIVDEELHEQWLTTHINLTHPGETQVWSFGSWEPLFRPGGPKTPDNAQTRSVVHEALFRSLFAHMRTDHIPRVSCEPPARWLKLLASGKLVSTPYDRGKILFGCMSEALWPYLEDEVVGNNPSPDQDTVESTNPNGTKLKRIARREHPYLKYLVPLSEQQATSVPPPGFHFAPLSRSQLQLMLDRSDIPRTIELLESLVSIGLVPNSLSGNKESSLDPIAWGVLGKDASISSLHTEPGYRGKGLAECVTKELIRLMDETFHCRYPLHNSKADSIKVDNVAFTHTDVSVNNMASRRVFEKLGGTIGWKTGWIEVMIGEEQVR